MEGCICEVANTPFHIKCDILYIYFPFRHVVLNVDRGMPWEQALKRLENHPGDDNGFYVSRRSRIRRFFILATAKETNVHVFKIARRVFLVCLFFYF